MNNMDGKVEAVFEGEAEKVEELIRWCHRGPSGARVAEVKVDREDYRDEFSEFSTKL
jgi:acylphosphatase